MKKSAIFTALIFIILIPSTMAQQEIAQQKIDIAKDLAKDEMRVAALRDVFQSYLKCNNERMKASTRQGISCQILQTKVKETPLSVFCLDAAVNAQLHPTTHESFKYNVLIAMKIGYDYGRAGGAK
jgi:hypothetical protein